MLQRSLTQTIRAAQTEIERHAQIQRAPMVLWAALEESPEAFAARITELRKRSYATGNVSGFGYDDIGRWYRVDDRADADPGQFHLGH